MANGHRWRLDLEYDGRPFAGFQVQDGAPTIQGHLEDALHAVLGERVRVSAAGRTDAGVSARQQVASVLTQVDRTAKAMRDGTNQHLPPEISVTHAAPVPLDFDPRRTPHSKRYVYTWLCRSSRSPLLSRAWHVRHKLDVQAMSRAAQVLCGTHDFSSFRATRCSATTTVRTLESITITQEGDLVRFAVEGTGFLRHMVRIIAGALTEVGRGSREPEWMIDVLQGCDRSLAGRTAPAEALMLDWIHYNEQWGWRSAEFGSESHPS